MRSFQKKLMAAAAGTSLVAVLGVCFAQAAQSGPDADVSNNETKTGIQDNSNNSYKTWPQSLYNSQQQQQQSTAQPSTEVSQAPAPAPAPAPAATDDTSTAQPQSTDTTAMGGATDNSAAAMPAPKADRN